MNLVLSLPLEVNRADVRTQAHGRMNDENINLHVSLSIATNRRMSKPLLRLLAEMPEFETYVRDQLKQAIRSEEVVTQLKKVPSKYKPSATEIYLTPEGKHFEIRTCLLGHADTEDELMDLIGSLDIRI